MGRILAAVRNPIHRGCLSLIYGCGLRISEAATLPVTAIDKTSGVLRVVGKGNKERLVPVPTIRTRPLVLSMAVTGRAAASLMRRPQAYIRLKQPRWIGLRMPRRMRPTSAWESVCGKRFCLGSRIFF